jgi:2,5-dioxopentanoate dehydrogenase
MGSVNPVFVLPWRAPGTRAKMAEAYIGSVTMGVGQFCTNPAMVLGIKSPELGTFLRRRRAGQKVAPQTMLHRGICETYEAGTAVWHTIGGLRLAGQSGTEPDHDATQAACRIFTTPLEVLEANEELQRERSSAPAPSSPSATAWRPCSEFARGLEGQLTAAIHGTPEDLRENAELVRILERKVGRLIFNGFGTGIEPCPSMHHGGPYPAASHSYFTSIGTGSIHRFVRPVCYQGFPDDCLPAPLQNANPGGAMRLVDSVLTRDVV